MLLFVWHVLIIMQGWLMGHAYENQVWNWFDASHGEINRFISVQAQGMLSLPTPPPRFYVSGSLTRPSAKKNNPKLPPFSTGPKKTKHGHEIWHETPAKKPYVSGKPLQILQNYHRFKHQRWFPPHKKYAPGTMYQTTILYRFKRPMYPPWN